MSKYLVTGGAGFIGSNIVEELLKRDETVRVLDNFITGSRDNLSAIKQYAKHDAQYELIEGDIRSKEDCQKALKGVDYVLHQAALRSVPKSVDNPFLTNDINVNGTLNLLFEAKRAGVKRLVYASSSSCYGDVAMFPQKEDFNPRPISPYGVSKLAAENYCHTFSKTFGLETVSLRYFNVFGLGGKLFHRGKRFGAGTGGEDVALALVHFLNNFRHLLRCFAFAKNSLGKSPPLVALVIDLCKAQFIKSAHTRPL